MQYSQRDLDEMSGEAVLGKAPTLNVPSIKFNGNTGEFYKIDGDKEILLGDHIEGTILKVRRKISEYSKEYKRFTPEHDSWQNKVNVFEVKKVVKGKEVKTKISSIDYGTFGATGTLSQKYPNMRLRQVVYLLLSPESEVVKLTIKGAGLSNWFDYINNRKPNEHFRDCVIRFGAEPKTNDAKMKYFAMTFEKIEDIKDETAKDFVAGHLIEVAESLNKIDEYYAKKSTEYDDFHEDKKIEFDDYGEPTIQIDEDEEQIKANEGICDDLNAELDLENQKVKNGEISVDDIPF